ncbi:hypothetical protein KCG48_12695 [Proteiniclasticum sp. BAD-10]|uniref:Uncharacterized protein n=1 Tax=Proteiniclasticum sediminis TaxID=2804028 RepID=A0A941CTA5_9CLOT|nr:hypothetical protein [Proteiniclasticum sediminis]MBR0577174.1 hypothetical protein [Proteiniclasticum sediminis]
MDKEIRDQALTDAANALRVQEQQRKLTSTRLSELAEDLTKLEEINRKNSQNIDDLLQIANEMFVNSGMTLSDLPDNTPLSDDPLFSTNSDGLRGLHIPHYEDLETVEVRNANDWNHYLEHIEDYARKNAINLQEDPFNHLLTSKDKEIIANRIKDDYMLRKANCDKLDYLIATFSGVVAGLVDSFFVGMPGESKLEGWSQDQTDKFVIKVAKMAGNPGKDNGKSEIVNAIKFFEDKYKINYDQPTGKAAGSVFDMSLSNHHIKSLGHAPDLIGLLFSVVSQFQGTSHFLDNGRHIVMDTRTQELTGNNFLAKLFSGIVNWIGHLISDVAGSSSGRDGNPDGRGSGIPIPMFELFQIVGKGEFHVKYSSSSNRYREMTLADLSVKVFEKGYDARFGVTLAVPVVLNELMTRLLWALKSRFIDNLSWKESIPIESDPNLRRVLLTSHGVLCLVDGVDAGIRSGGEILTFALHLNFVAWKRLAFSGLLEVRSLYKEKALDLNAMEKDIEKEWSLIFDDSSIHY